EAILGDLAEQLQSGQSRRWYWRQVISLIVQALARDVRDSWPFLVGVIICGVIVTNFAPLVIAAILTFPEQLFLRGFGWFYLHGHGFPSMVLNHPWLIIAVLYALIGWGVGRVAGHRHAAVVFTFAASVSVGGLIAPLTAFAISLPMLSFRFNFAF